MALERRAVDPLVGGVGEQRVAGTEVDGGDAVGGEAGDVGPAELGPHLEPRSTSGGEQRVVEPRRRALGDVDDARRSSPSSSAGASSARTAASASAASRSGAKRWLSVTVARSGTTLPATPPVDAHRLQRLAVLAAVEHRAALGHGLDERQQPPEPVDGVASHPRPGGVGPGPGERDLEAHRALAPGLDGAVGGLAEDGGVAGQQVGPLDEQLLEAAVGRPATSSRA